jgi:hypothetical protein
MLWLRYIGCTMQGEVQDSVEHMDMRGYQITCYLYILLFIAPGLNYYPHGFVPQVPWERGDPD